MSVLVWAAVVLIGGAGSVLRFYVDGLVSSASGRDFPYGTLVVNLSGAVILGLLTGLALERRRRAARRHGGRRLLHDVLHLDAGDAAAGRGAPASQGGANIAVSLVLGVAAAALGRLIGAQL